MPEKVKVTFPTEAVMKQYAKLQEFMNAKGATVKVKGMPRPLLFNTLKVVPLLVEYLEYVLAGVKVIAEPSKNGCVGCAATAAFAQDLLRGPKVDK